MRQITEQYIMLSVSPVASALDGCCPPPLLHLSLHYCQSFLTLSPATLAAPATLDEAWKYSKLIKLIASS